MTETNSNLIPVTKSTINNESVQTVNARELHQFLESKQDFSTWIKARINQYGFVDNQDFVRIDIAPQKNGALESTGYAQERKEYYITLDMAKELAMVERNAKGKQARQYFIECERRLKSAPPAELTREQILVMALDSERERIRLAHELEAAQPMVQFHDEVRQAEGELKIDQACAILFNGSISAKKLREWLRNQGWMDKRKGMNKPTVWAIKHDYMRLRLSNPINKMVFEVPVITANGLTLLRHLYRTGELFLSTIPIEKRIAASTYQV